MSETFWHAYDVAETLDRLGTSTAGLGDEEAVRRLNEIGPNQLFRHNPVSALRILGHQLTSLVVLLLGAAALVALALGDHIEAAAIAAVLLLNTAIGFVTELRARRAMDALLQFEVPRATVVRGGRAYGIESSQLVPGDVVDLVAGQAVPADGRLISGTEFRTSEAALTELAVHRPPHEAQHERSPADEQHGQKGQVRRQRIREASQITQDEMNEDANERQERNETHLPVARHVACLSPTVFRRTGDVVSPQLQRRAQLHQTAVNLCSRSCNLPAHRFFFRN